MVTWGPRLTLCHTVSAGVAAASVPPLLAVGAGEAERTDAAVAAGALLHAASSVEARLICAGDGADLAVLPVEALRTGAGVAVHLVLEGGQAGQVRKDNRAPPPCRSLTVQLPPFLQGLLSHSLVWISQFLPVKPLGQAQV